MPIYEYVCRACEQRVSIWFRSVAQAASQEALCTECGSADLVRLMSQVAVASGASASTGMSTGAGASATGDASPQALAQAMRAASAGRDMGSDFREVASRLERGESATKVEQSLRKRVGEDMQAH